MVSLFDAIIPDSLGDGGAFLFWFLIAFLLGIVILDVRMYVLNQRSSRNKSPTPQKIYYFEEVVTPVETEDHPSEIDDIQTKVDQLIQAHEL
ncbi:MAG: hypothetical protein MUC80_06345 [Candidatus Thermoplasmatota archaeon]|nr:hypothetical protein [Candidatus Thermoplasmatota archaeon]